MKKIAFFLNKAVSQPQLYLPILANLLVNAFIWFLIIWRLPAQTDWIPLYYNVYFGIGWIGPWLWVIYYPGVCLIILILNIVFSAYLEEGWPILARWLIWSVFCAQIFTLISILSLIINYFS
ncbi:MAG: hypothetical protein WCV73_04765 [Patescibacteria group bacterium]|jgi:hypothetical protein